MKRQNPPTSPTPGAKVPGIYVGAPLCVSCRGDNRVPDPTTVPRGSHPPMSMGSQEREGIGAHTMWGYAPAQDLLRDAPLQGEVSQRQKCSQKRKYARCTVTVYKSVTEALLTSTRSLLLTLCQPSLVTGEHFDMSARRHWAPVENHRHAEAAPSTHDQRKFQSSVSYTR